ncbi:MAG: hypothetical protein R3F24_03680 [Gammaproteobacteria bacterium]
MKPNINDDPLKYIDQRPVFSAAPGVDRLFAVCMALTEQLAVANERHDTLIRVLSSKGLVTPEELEAYMPDATVEAAREAQHAQLIKRVLQILDLEIDERESDAS